jgi:hypothetical protein
MSLAKIAKRHATTLVLSALALTAGAVVFVVDRGAVTTDEAEARKKNLFTAWRPDEIESVTIERGGKTARLARKPPDERGQRFWEITLGDRRFPAEEQLVDQLLGTLEFATYERTLAPGSADPASLGLEAPRVRFSIVMSGHATALSIGGPAPSPAGAANVEVRGDGKAALHVINAQLLAALDVDPETLRARKIVPYVSADLARIEIDLPGGSFHLARAKDRPDELHLAGPTKDAGLRASRGATDELFAALGRAEADAFLPDEVAAAATTTPAVTIALIPKDSSRPKAVVAFGGACPDKPEHVVAVVREPSSISACVSKDTLEGLTRPAESFVDRGLFVATIDEVEEIAVTSGERKLELARRGTGFHQRAPEEREVEGQAGRALLEPLLALRASGFVTGKDKPSLGLEPPRATIKITSLLAARSEDGGNDDRFEEVLIGAPEGDTIPALRVSDGAILALPASAARLLSPSTSALRSPTLVDEPETNITALRVTQGDRSQQIERTPEGGWKLLAPAGKGLTADLGLGTDLSTALLPLRTERFVADKDDGSFGLDKPRLVLEADLGARPDAGARRTIRLLFGAPTQEGAFARLEGDDAVFLVDKKLESAASQWLLDRSIFSLDLGDIVKVTVSFADKKKAPVVLERKGGVLLIPADPAATARAAAIRDALADLVPEGAVSVGAPRKEQGLDPPAVTVTIEREKRDAGGKETATVIDPSRTVRLHLGAGDSFQGTSIVYARREGVDATYAIAKAKTKAFE